MDLLRVGIDEKNAIQVREAFDSLSQELKETDAWANDVDEFGETILQKAAAGDEDIMRFLLSKLKDEKAVLKADDEGRTLLHFAVLGGDIGTVASLVSMAPSLAAVGDKESGMIPLHLAARDGLAHILGLLLRKSDINAQDSNGMTALHISVTNKRKDVAKLLLEHGAKVDVKNSRGKTPGELAKEADNIEFIELLAPK